MRAIPSLIVFTGLGWALGGPSWAMWGAIFGILCCIASLQIEAHARASKVAPIPERAPPPPPVVPTADPWEGLREPKTQAEWDRVWPIMWPLLRAHLVTVRGLDAALAGC